MLPSPQATSLHGVWEVLEKRGWGPCFVGAFVARWGRVLLSFCSVDDKILGRFQTATSLMQRKCLHTRCTWYAWCLRAAISPVDGTENHVPSKSLKVFSQVIS